MKRSVAAPNEDSFYQRSEEYTEKALEKKSVALGYTFDQTDYSNEIAAVTSVMSQYLSSLEYGPWMIWIHTMKSSQALLAMPEWTT